MGAGPLAAGDHHRGTWAQQHGWLRVADFGVDPVQRAEHNHRTPRCVVRWPPVLERAGHHGDIGEARDPFPGHGGERCAKLDGGDREPALRERHRRLPRARGELKHPVTWRKVSQAHQVVEQLRRTDRPRPLVHLGVVIEPAAQFYRGGGREPGPPLLSHGSGPLVAERRCSPAGCADQPGRSAGLAVSGGPAVSAVPDDPAD